MRSDNRRKLPRHPARRYDPVGRCIYCGATSDLTDEHIVPFGLGGRWELPKASCRSCARRTGAFEGIVQRTILGPLRMLYSLPSRRLKDRPKTLPLKVKYAGSTDWEIAHVSRDVCPFLIGLPTWELPDEITGAHTTGDRSCAARNIWIRGGGFWPDRQAQADWLCAALGATEIMPSADISMKPFCQMLAKIAHAFASAELGSDGFEPFLTPMICQGDTSNRAQFIGCDAVTAAPSNQVHEVSFPQGTFLDPLLIVVRIRLLAMLDTPTYFVAVGRQDEGETPRGSKGD